MTTASTPTSMRGAEGWTRTRTPAAPAHGPDHGERPDSAAAPFLSLRFWVFGLTFFGLTGAVVGTLRLAGPVTTTILAAAVGIQTGYIAARVFRSLMRARVGRVAGAEAHIGREGRLLLPVAPGQPGKVRFTAASGAAVDLVAEATAPLPAGAAVLIVALDGDVALVKPTLIPSDPSDKEPR
jgi:membrane protein implicated in regulation of membrane protease activity